ncbi:MAG: hypothetical protein L3J24_07845 [Xanthomonadales bacterium]|nr:hypothetical protein [Xanthomonadales bacterium]
MKKKYLVQSIVGFCLISALPFQAQAAVTRFIVKNSTESTTFQVVVKNSADSSYNKNGNIKPGEEFQFKEAAICEKEAACIYTIKTTNGTVIANGGLSKKKDGDLIWFDHDGDGSKKDDVSGDAYRINNDKKNSTRIMKILKVMDS